MTLYFEVSNLTINEQIEKICFKIEELEENLNKLKQNGCCENCGCKNDKTM